MENDYKPTKPDFRELVLIAKLFFLSFGVSLATIPILIFISWLVSEGLATTFAGVVCALTTSFMGVALFLVFLSVVGLVFEVISWKKDRIGLEVYGDSVLFLVADMSLMLIIGEILLLLSAAFGLIGLAGSAMFSYFFAKAMKEQAEQAATEPAELDVLSSPDYKLEEHISFSTAFIAALVLVVVPVFSELGISIVALLGKYWGPQALVIPYTFVSQAMPAFVLTTSALWGLCTIAMMRAWKMNHPAVYYCSLWILILMNCVLLVVDFVAIIIALTALFGWWGTILAIGFDIVCAICVGKRARRAILSLRRSREEDSEEQDESPLAEKNDET